MDDCARPGRVQRRDRGGDVLTGLGDVLLRHDLDALEPRRPPEVLQVCAPDVRPLDQHPGRRLRCLGHEMRPEDRLVAHRPVVQQERPLTQPVLRTADADRRHPEPSLDLVADRHRVLADVGADHGHAALVDELAERIDRRLDAALRQTLCPAVVDLHRAVDHVRRMTVPEHQLHRLRVVAPVISAAAQVIQEETDLDGLRFTRFRHRYPLVRRTADGLGHSMFAVGRRATSSGFP